MILKSVLGETFPLSEEKKIHHLINFSSSAEWLLMALHSLRRSNAGLLVTMGPSIRSSIKHPTQIQV